MILLLPMRRYLGSIPRTARKKRRYLFPAGCLWPEPQPQPPGTPGSCLKYLGSGISRGDPACPLTASKTNRPRITSASMPPGRQGTKRRKEIFRVGSLCLYGRGRGRMNPKSIFSLHLRYTSKGWDSQRWFKVMVARPRLKQSPKGQFLLSQMFHGVRLWSWSECWQSDSLSKGFRSTIMELGLNSHIWYAWFLGTKLHNDTMSCVSVQKLQLSN